MASGVQWYPNFEPQWEKEICSNYQEAGKFAVFDWWKGMDLFRIKGFESLEFSQYSIAENSKNFFQGPDNYN